MTAWVEFPHLYELQRPKASADERLIAERFRPYLEARDWVSINRGEVVGFGPDRSGGLTTAGRAQAASWKMRPRVWRRPLRSTLTPWRMGAAAQPRAERTGRSRVVKTSAVAPLEHASPWPGDWARGRCSVITNSPPVKSAPGRSRPITTWSGNTSSP